MKNRNVDKLRNMDKNQSVESDFIDTTTFNSNNHYSYELFPKMRLRRLRKTAAIRELLQEIRLSPKDFVIPVFVQEGINKNLEIESMPGIFRLPHGHVLKNIESLYELGLRAFLLFGLPTAKDSNGSSAFHNDGVVQRSVELLRKTFSDKIVFILNGGDALAAKNFSGNIFS